jgi:hypothetical protein
MGKISLLPATSVALVLGASTAYAMCGGNLSPARTPYAMFQPQTAATVLSASSAAARSPRVKASPTPHG